MESHYEKVIIKENNGEKQAVVIFNEKTHAPEFYTLNKCGMDEVLELLNKAE